MFALEFTATLTFDLMTSNSILVWQGHLLVMNNL